MKSYRPVNITMMFMFKSRLGEVVMILKIATLTLTGTLFLTILILVISEATKEYNSSHNFDNVW